MKITSKVKNSFERQKSAVFGTADSEGNPNVVQIFWKNIPNDETVLLLDNYMGMSKHNVLENTSIYTIKPGPGAGSQSWK